MIKDYKYYLFSVLVLAFTEISCLHASDGYEYIRSEVLKMFRALEKGNYIYPVQHMYPPIVEAAGG